MHVTVLSVPHVDERDWSALTHGDRVRQLEVEGYVVLPNLLSPEHIARLKLETRQLPTTPVDYSVHQRVYSNPRFAGRAIVELAAFPPMLEFLERLSGPGFVLMSYAYARSQPGHPVAVTQAVPVLESVGALVGGSEAG